MAGGGGRDVQTHLLGSEEQPGLTELVSPNRMRQVQTLQPSRVTYSQGFATPQRVLNSELRRNFLADFKGLWYLISGSLMLLYYLRWSIQFRVVPETP